MPPIYKRQQKKRSVNPTRSTSGHGANVNFILFRGKLMLPYRSAHAHASHGKGIAPSTTVHKASGAVIDDACTVFDDGSVLLFGELSSLSLTTRVPCFLPCMRNVDDREHAPRLFRCIHCACSGRVIKFFFDF